MTGSSTSRFTLTYDELLAMPPTNLTKDFQCVTGWRVRRREVEGREARATCSTAPACNRRAKALRFTSFDGVYTESLTLEQARRDDVIVAYELEGKAISSDHGGPVRLYVAPMYGYKSCKWLDGIEVVDRVHPRLLGRARLRRRRVGRQEQRPRRRADVPVTTIAAEHRRFPRFDRLERVVHWTNATLFFVLIAHRRVVVRRAAVRRSSAARELVKTIHVYAGLLLPIPVLLGVAAAGRPSVPARPRPRSTGWTTTIGAGGRTANASRAQLGKFNPGQKLNATFIGAAIVVMLGTGSIMRWFEPFPARQLAHRRDVRARLDVRSCCSS